MQAEGGKSCFDAGIEIGPDGEPTGKIICYPSDNCRCIVVREPKPGATASTGFISLSEPTPFHDDVLIKATHEINEILARMARETQQDSRKTSLHIFLADEGPMLVWVDKMAMPLDNIHELSAMKPW